MTRDCLSCAEPIESTDGHESCIFCLGRAHAPNELAQLALPRSSSAASFEPRKKVPRVSDADLSGSGDEPAPAQWPRAPHPPAAGPLPVRFMTAVLQVHNPGSSLLSSVDGADQVGYVKLPHVEEAVASHFCPSTAANWRVRNNGSLPSKPCRATANLAGKAFSAAGQAASALHVMRYSRCIRPSCSSLWMRMGRSLKCSKSSDAPRIWPSERRR